MNARCLGSAVVAFAFATAGLATHTGLAEAAAPKCSAEKGKPRAFVRPKTPLRRGPGLNYPVSSFLEKGGCLAFSQLSADEQWVLVEKKSMVGWIPVSRLSRASAEKVTSGETPRVEPAVGSGQTRGKARVRRQAMLLERPDSEAAPKRVLPVDLEVVPLSVTETGRWVEVRDERAQTGWVLTANLEGDALSGLPVSEVGFDKGVVGVESTTSTGASATVVGSSNPRAGSTDAGVTIAATVLIGALQPIHKLDSNANLGRRRYTISALAPAVGLEADITDLGPIAVRLGYTFAYLSGVVPDQGNQGSSGMQHDANLRIGLPLAAGPLLITPELGYSLSIFSFDSMLVGSIGPTIVSSTGHLGSVGTRLQVFLSESFMLEANGAFMLGASQESPRDLGSNGLSIGGQGMVGAQYFFSDTLGLTFRYGGTTRKTTFSGPSRLDSSLTEATITDASHGLLLGLSFILAG